MLNDEPIIFLYSINQRLVDLTASLFFYAKEVRNGS
nr:MAG TPA: hypothetical protein [Caudoviricetes sp.]